MEKEWAIYNEIIHPDDLSNTWKLIKNIWDFIFTVPPAFQEQFKFNYDYRIIKPDGKEVRMLTQNSVLQTDSKGTITHVLGVYSDISHWKKNEQQIASVISTSTIPASSLPLTTAAPTNPKWTIASGSWEL